MRRSKYYTPAKPPTLTYGLVAVLAVLVFGGMIYLNFSQKSERKWLSATPYPSNYPVMVEASFVSPDNVRYEPMQLACPYFLLTLPKNSCASTFEQHQSLYREFSQLLQTKSIFVPPLLVVSPVPHQSKALDTNAQKQATCPTQTVTTLEGSWQSISQYHQHLNFKYEIPTMGENSCTEKPSTKVSPWVLFDAQARPKLYIHNHRSTINIAKDYLNVLIDKIDQ